MAEYLKDPVIFNLMQKAVDAMKFAYCPYSKFLVGAAVLCEDGSVYTGCNVENAVYGLTICAEKTALVKAISEGHTKFKAIGVTSSSKDAVSPCGSCRQFLIEFGDFDVYLTTPDMSTVRKFTTSGLLPAAFGPEILKAAQPIIMTNTT